MYYKYRTLSCFIVLQIIIPVSKQKKDHFKGEKSMLKGQVWKIEAVTTICFVTGSIKCFIIIILFNLHNSFMK